MASAALLNLTLNADDVFISIFRQLGTTGLGRFGMFERTLQDLIRGLRAHKASSKSAEDAFIAEAMAEIRDELRGKDMALKAEGVLKMCYVRRRVLAQSFGWYGTSSSHSS